MDEIRRLPARAWGPTRTPPSRPLFPALVATGVALSLLLGVGAAGRALPPASVDIQDSKYVPQALTVAPGTTVRWINRDEETHTVTSSAGLFGSAGLDLGEAYSYTFTAPGVYPYTCDLHAFMQGTIVVK